MCCRSVITLSVPKISVKLLRYLALNSLMLLWKVQVHCGGHRQTPTAREPKHNQEHKQAASDILLAAQDTNDPEVSPA